MHNELKEPSGPKPRSIFGLSNLVVYGTITLLALYYLAPLYVMLVTSLKSMAEVRLGNVFALPVNLTFDPWFKAWSSACTGLKCEGLMGGFLNSVIITVPSVIVSIAIASVNGYASAKWPYRGANIFYSRF